MSSPPSSRRVSLIAVLTLFSSLTSQRKAIALTPKLLRSITVCCASRPECRKVMATSAPASAKAKADARPRRRAPPVMRTVFPESGLADATCADALFADALCIDRNCIVIANLGPGMEDWIGRCLEVRHSEAPRFHPRGRGVSREQFQTHPWQFRLSQWSDHWNKPCLNCYTQRDVRRSPSRGLLAQRMSPVRDRQRNAHQTAPPRRIRLAGNRRRQRRPTPPPVHRRSPSYLHRRPQSLQISHGRIRFPAQARQLNTPVFADTWPPECSTWNTFPVPARITSACCALDSTPTLTDALSTTSFSHRARASRIKPPSLTARAAAALPTPSTGN